MYATTGFPFLGSLCGVAVKQPHANAFCDLNDLQLLHCLSAHASCQHCIVGGALCCSRTAPCFQQLPDVLCCAVVAQVVRRSPCVVARGVRAVAPIAHRMG